MKKIVIIGTAGVLALALGTSTLALAHFGRRTGEILSAETVPVEEDRVPASVPGEEACIFTDENHDGYCDYGDVHYHSGNHIDDNHDGICDSGDHFCMDYYDADGDGICDNCHDATHHNSYYGNDASNNGDSGYRNSENGDSGYRNSGNGDSGYRNSENGNWGYHHSEGHGAGHHHR